MYQAYAHGSADNRRHVEFVRAALLVRCLWLISGRAPGGLASAVKHPEEMRYYASFRLEGPRLVSADTTRFRDVFSATLR
jgi:hypothetical protein